MSTGYINIPSAGDEHWKGPVALTSSLPLTNNSIGDVRLAEDTNTIYVWGGSSWLAVATPGAAIAIDGLIGDVSASGPGTVPATVNSVGGATAANVASTVTTVAAATNLATASTLVKRDSSGNFDAITLNDTSGVASVNVNTRRLVSSGTGIIVDWASAQLTAGGNITLDWDAMKLTDSSNVVSMTWDNHALWDTSGLLSVNYGGRILTRSDATTALNWTGPSILASTGGSGGALQVQTATGPTAAGLQLFDGSNVNSATLKSPDSGLTSYTLTLPSAAPLSNGQALTFSTSGIGSFTTIISGINQLTGDATAGPGTGSQALTLATVNSNVGTFGSSTAIPAVTVNGKGLVTVVSTNAVIAPAGTLSGTTLNSTVVSSSLTSVGTITSGTWNGTTIAVANGGTNSTTALNNNYIIVSSGGKIVESSINNTSIWTLNGGMNGTTRTITGNLTVDTTTTDYIIFCNQSGAITITLPTPTNGRILKIKDISGTAQTNNISIAQHASETIEGIAATKVLQTNFGAWTFSSDGTNWWMM